ncbi:hypothetical protein [Desulfovibrio sp. JC022]|uniref:hypothetical protein n=1 Tax=Desulfovibrio sp. JC022 TaxID=2593642 RepID=UPI0013D60797|nr:hypothetical protein [Desulfovibrio sp. JC022]NDV24942.1 hypothetical protein [Desulfovibrio sp. JC022]
MKKIASLPLTAVAEALAGTDGYLAVDDFFSRAKPDFPDVDHEEIQRVLDLLVAYGMARRLDFGCGVFLYSKKQVEEPPFFPVSDGGPFTIDRSNQKQAVTNKTVSFYQPLKRLTMLFKRKKTYGSGTHAWSS